MEYGRGPNEISPSLLEPSGYQVYLRVPRPTLRSFL